MLAATIARSADCPAKFPLDPPATEVALRAAKCSSIPRRCGAAAGNGMLRLIEADDCARQGARRTLQKNPYTHPSETQNVNEGLRDASSSS